MIAMQTGRIRSVALSDFRADVVMRTESGSVLLAVMNDSSSREKLAQPSDASHPAGPWMTIPII